MKTNDPTKSRTGLDSQIETLRKLAAELHDGPDSPGGLHPAVWGADIADDLEDIATEIRRWADERDVLEEAA